MDGRRKPPEEHTPSNGSRQKKKIGNKKRNRKLADYKPPKGTKLKQMKKANAEVNVTIVTQSGNDILKTKEKQMYYLKIETEAGEALLNVGEKTYNKVKFITDENEIQKSKKLNTSSKQQ
ncbi:MAG: hypothetical protein [Microviridae sp.]|nr:MAG: hypothetical protein [Microviridae sp.]